MSKRPQNKDRRAKKHQKKTKEEKNASDTDGDTALAADIYSIAREK